MKALLHCRYGSFSHSAIIYLNRTKNLPSSITLTSNPVGNSFGYFINGKQGTAYTVRITDMSGNILVTQDNVSSNAIHQVEAGSLLAGMYTLEARDKTTSESMITKILKR